ncbi:Beta-glucuronidase [Grifola frondosa]|uniref:Beta-glucuronidase n=1 Tax=Grifola frondosa TaxID=5627 RepID=A0A1C7MCX7_GRIFR|nr:Beta-glucuronidase [Grifola frondosa]
MPSGAVGASTATVTADEAWITALQAYNSVQLTAPALPSPLPSNQFGISVQNNAQDMSGLSIQQAGTFMGFSIEMSVANQVIGKSPAFLQVPFLNLMAIIAERAGSVHIRVGGNTQETATLVLSTPDGAIIEKDKTSTTNPTDTPALIFTPGLLYMLANVSSLVNTKWYLGIPFNDTTNLRLEIAEYGESILGSNVLGFQVGNEPDLYVAHGHRPANYSVWDYFGEFGVVVNAIAADAQIPTRNNLIAPSLQGTWTPEDVFNTGFVAAYTNALGILSVEHYPDDNCAAAYPDAGFGAPKDPQTEFPNFLTHASGQGIVSAYLNATSFAQSVGKPFMMFETNTASCGGFPGISDAFGSALWALDYGLQMAYTNFTGALLHVGGQDVSYNPFTPPPTNLSTFNQWTVGPVFYSAVVIAEALGTSGTARVVDLFANNASDYTPGYAIYENGALARMVLVNYMTDPSGANSYTATISVNSAPASVKVLGGALRSGEKQHHVAGQGLGGRFEVDGRWQGTEQINTINCDQGANTCAVQVPAPGAALVFFSDSALQEVEPSSTVTFATTALTKTVNTVTINASVLATSNGENGSMRGQLSSTSKGSSSAVSSHVVPGVTALAMMLAGVCVLSGMLRR